MPLTVYLGEMSAGSIRAVAIDYRTDGSLDDGESLTGTPTIVELTTSDLTLSNKAVSTGTLTIDGETVAAGDALQWTITTTSDLAGSYTMRATVSTDATPAQTIVRDYQVIVR